MQMTYSPTADAVAIELAPEATSARTQHMGPDIIADFDARGRLVSLEILNASDHYPAAALQQLSAPVEYLTLAEAAKESGLAPATLRLQASRQRLAAVKRGRDWLIPRHALWNYLENREPSGRPPASTRARRIRRATAKKLTPA
jgi:uncharacterized protein YuzE